MARQLTIRGVPDELARRLQVLSREKQQSINATVLAILEAAVDHHGRRRRLERYATWTEEDPRWADVALALRRASPRGWAS